MPAPSRSPRPEPRPDRNQRSGGGFSGIAEQNRGDGNDIREARSRTQANQGGGNPNPNGRQASPRQRKIFNTKMGVATQGVERSGKLGPKTDFSTEARLGGNRKKDPRYK